MARMNVPGTVYRRKNGKFQAITPEVYDPEQGRHRRPSLRIYENEAEAEAALIRFHEARNSSSFYLIGTAIRSQRLGEYFDEWIELFRNQERSGQLSVRTVSGYESAVRIHIRPALGDVRLGTSAR